MLRSTVLAGLWLAMTAMTPASAQTLGGDAAACQAGNEPAIRVNITGLKDRTGRLKLELYPANPTDFLRDDNQLTSAGKTFRRIWAQTPAAGPVSMCIKAPRPGRYALFFTHDRDGKNKFNIWSDGAGITSNAKIGASKPKVEMSEIDVGPGVTTVNIMTQYIRGLSGFAPERR